MDTVGFDERINIREYLKSNYNKILRTGKYN